MTTFAKEPIESASEALAIADGKLQPVKFIAPETIDVAAIRKRLNLSQNKFGARFGLSPATVRDWEHKRRQPDRIATNLLKVIAHAPETVERALAK